MIKQINQFTYKNSIKDAVTPDTVKINTEIKTSSKSSPAKCTPLDGAPFHHWNELNQMQEKMPTSAEDSSDPVFVIDASIMEKLPTSSDSPIRKQNYTELPKRVPIVIQRTIKVHNFPSNLLKCFLVQWLIN